MWMKYQNRSTTCSENTCHTCNTMHTQTEKGGDPHVNEISHKAQKGARKGQCHNCGKDAPDKDRYCNTCYIMASQTDRDLYEVAVERLLEQTDWDMTEQLKGDELHEYCTATRIIHGEDELFCICGQ